MAREGAGEAHARRGAQVKYQLAAPPPDLQTTYQARFRPEVEQRLRDECSNNRHPFVAIYATGSDMEGREVVWCPLCGAVRIDVTYDSRRNRGQAMAMRIPKNSGGQG